MKNMKNMKNMKKHEKYEKMFFCCEKCVFGCVFDVVLLLRIGFLIFQKNMFRFFHLFFIFILLLYYDFEHQLHCSIVE